MHVIYNSILMNSSDVKYFRRYRVLDVANTYFLWKNIQSSTYMCPNAFFIAQSKCVKNLLSFRHRALGQLEQRGGGVIKLMWLMEEGGAWGIRVDITIVQYIEFVLVSALWADVSDNQPSGQFPTRGASSSREAIHKCHWVRILHKVW